MPKFEVLEIVQTVNRIQVFGESKEAVEKLYFDGEYNGALDECGGEMEVVHSEVEEVKEPKSIDYSHFVAKD